MQRAVLRDLAVFFLQLSQMEKAGVPLRDALRDAAGAAQSRPLRRAAAGMAAALGRGQNLREAMAAHPQLFDATLAGLVAAGEKGGRLAFALGRCHDILRSRAERKSRMTRATLQAWITLAVVLGVAAFRQGAASLLPLAVLAALVLAVVLLRRFAPSFRAGTDALLLLLPGIGGIARQHSAARLCENIAILHECGLDLKHSLHAAGQSVPNLAVRREAWEALLLVEGGASLHSAFSAATRLDALALAMIKAGEDSGALAKTLREASSYYDRKTDEAVTALQQVSDPALVVFAGVMLYLSLRG